MSCQVWLTASRTFPEGSAWDFHLIGDGLIQSFLPMCFIVSIKHSSSSYWLTKSGTKEYPLVPCAAPWGDGVVHFITLALMLIGERGTLEGPVQSRDIWLSWAPITTEWHGTVSNLKKVWGCQYFLALQRRGFIKLLQILYHTTKWHPLHKRTR